MGLGKTAQSISTLEFQRQLCDIPGPFLIVAPLTTLGHWQREVETWTSMVRPATRPVSDASAQRIAVLCVLCYAVLHASPKEAQVPTLHSAKTTSPTRMPVPPTPFPSLPS